MKLPIRRRSSPGARRNDRRTRVAQGAALTVIAGTLVVLAVKYDGSPIHDVELNDGGVWVTNSSRGLIGRLNSQIEELDLAIATSPTSDAVFQQGNNVQVYDDGGSPDSTVRGLTVIDVVTGLPLTIPLSGDYEAAAAGTTIAILDNESGNVWLRRPEQLEGFTDTVAPDTTVSPNSGVIVTRSGTALVSDRSAGTITAWAFDETGTAVEGDSFEFNAEFLDDASLSAVGETPVVLQAGKLYRPDQDAIVIDGEQPMLQQVGPDADDVYVATETGLWQAGLHSDSVDEVSSLDVDGYPAAPVLVDSCVHAAWNHPGHDNYMVICDGTDETTGEIAPLNVMSSLVFRSNRDVVVLNDVTDGTMWMVQEPGLTRISDWDSVDPNAEDPQKAEADDQSHTSTRNQPPTAVKDEFGVRPDATVVLPVTLNDIDPDGDILVLTQPPAAQGDTTFSLVGEGTQVQARIAPNASGVIKFTYEITDGQAGHGPSEAEVTLKIIESDSTDKAPEPIKDQEVALRVADGYQASVNVLPAYIDPEGDSVVLVAAEADGGRVGYRPDGTIDFTDDGSGVGTETVSFTLRGGKAEKTYSFLVTVVEPDTAEPTTVADHFSGAAGSQILLEPLKNDTDPLGGPLVLAKIRNVSERPALVVADSTLGVATFKADQPGSYYLEYAANGSNGVGADDQVVRVDVAPLTGANKPPVAMRDIAAVGADGTALVDVLANDTDPDGDVLVVQGIRMPGARYAGNVAVSLINKRFVRVEATGDLGDRQPVVEYLLSDGRSDQVTGAIAVTSFDAGTNRPPVAVEDVVTARAGTVIAIPVLDNDDDPDGDRMTVSQQDLFDTGRARVVRGGRVPIVADGTSIRVLVPDDGTTQLQFGYGARDARRGRGDTRVVLNIQPDDRKANQKPQPRPVEDRTVTGQKVRVAIDTFGADPDGDPVVYAGVVEPPRLGRIVATGTDWFEYEPLEGANHTGTDEFKVLVSDQYGLTGVADIRIGVARPAQENQAPSALSDELLVKPGLTVQYPVLQNDSDPDGDPLILEEDDIRPSEGTTARLADTYIEVETPEVSGDREVVQAVEYEVSDGLGASASAVFSVTVSNGAPDYAPTTQDDVVGPDQLRGKSEGDTVHVEVLENDGDLDGARADLTVEPVDPETAELVDNELRVTLRADSQVVPYRVTDGTEQFSFGFVYVAGTDTLAPILDTTAVPIEVTAGEEKTVRLGDVIVVRPGHEPYLGNTDRIDPTNGDAKPKGGASFLWKSPADYFGPASVTLPVIDEKTLNTAGVLESQITIPFTVLPAQNEPPVVRNTAVTLYAGQESVSLRLDRLATDPNPDDDLEFKVDPDEIPQGVSADVGGRSLTFTADGNAGTADTLITVTADDGDATAEGQVRVVVIGSEDENDELPAELMTLRDLQATDASAREPVRVDVQSAVLNDPFPDKDKKIISASAPASVQVSDNGGTGLTITPSDAGEFVVTYLLDDGSGDPKRAVDGRVTVVVADVPDQPGAPRAVEGGPDSVQLTWTAPNDNGSAISHYLVEGTPGGDAECRATQCTVTGLEPGEEYRFTVTAVNGEGKSESSPASTPVTPDTVPGPMAAPIVISGVDDRNGRLLLNWKKPDNEGSPIERYLITVTGGNGGTIPVEGENITEKLIEGLENGRDYQFRIAAENAEGEGPESPLSAPETPFTVPETMPAPHLTATNDNGDGEGFISVEWSSVGPPQDGYNAITKYTVRLFKDGQAEATRDDLGGQATEVDFNVENGHSYTAAIMPTNEAGDAPAFSPESNASISWDRAKAVTGIANGGDCPDNKCAQSTSSYFGKVNFTTPADDGGYPVTHYRYTTSAGTVVVDAPTTASGVGTSLILPFANAATGQTVTLVPITYPPGEGTVFGTAARGGSFNPYALPPAPTISGQSGGYRSVTLSFNCGDGNGRSVDQSDVSKDSGGSVNGCQVSWSGNEVEGGTTKCATARVHNAAGWSASSSRACGTSSAKTVDVSVEGYGGNPPGPCTQNCDAIRLTVGGFGSGSNYGYSTNIVASDGSGVVSGSINTDGEGRGTKYVAYYDRTVYDETYCVTVQGIQGCARGR